MPWRECCPVCDSTAVEDFLRRESVPVHQNLLLDDRASARGLSRGELAMAVCWSCGFVFNRAFDSTLLNYGSAYENTQTHSPAFGQYVEDLARHLIDERGVRNRTIVEVGCGKGGFLTRLVAAEELDNRGIGYDPSYLGPENLCSGRLQFRRMFYDENSRDPADVVVCRHVIEHVEWPQRLLTSIRQALDSSPQARVFFETPCVEWILRNQVVWDFFYEHCSLFTSASLTTAFRRAGFDVVGCRHVFGGQYLWLEATPAANSPSGIPHDGAELVSLCRRFRDGESRLRTNWSGVVQGLGATGAVGLWGAGAKGVTFANLLDPDGDRLDCVVDVNPAKQGRYLAGTGTPIVSPDRLAARNVRSVIVLNPNYRDEIERRLAEQGGSISIVDLMHSKKAA